jgi:hypothetical protein
MVAKSTEASLLGLMMVLNLPVYISRSGKNGFCVPNIFVLESFSAEHIPR